MTSSVVSGDQMGSVQFGFLNVPTNMSRIVLLLSHVGIGLSGVHIAKGGGP